MTLLPYERKSGQGIYVHIPFCVRKCRYCDFLSFAAGEEEKADYVDALVREIRERTFPGPEEEVSSIFFGGGTPTVLRAGQLIRILEAVRERFTLTRDCEITTECNPGTADGESLRLLSEAGFNRLSIGLQSANESELKLLGRIHSFDDYAQCMRNARKAGFDNINTDLIFSLPGQSLSSWKETLSKTLAFEPEHISTYSLIIEEGTEFYSLYHEEDERRSLGEMAEALPGEEEERQMYLAAEEILGEAGFGRYEISNFARPGRESIHNTGTWLRRRYEGFGPGASSLVGERDVRLTNTRVMTDYLAGRWEDPTKTEQLTEEARMAETMFLGLRLKEGVAAELFEREYKKAPDKVYPGPIRQFAKEGLIETAGGRIRLTKRGTDLANYVMAAFLD